MDLSALARYLPDVEQVLGTSYDLQRDEVPLSVRPYVGLNREFSLRGGKRFRALLVLAGYHLASGRTPTPVIPAAAALEHFQSWMLVHDDIIDHASERRGGRTVHLLASELHRTEQGAGSGDDYGVGVAITLGDLEEPYTLDGILSVRVPERCRLAALGELVRMTRLTAYGQLLDLRNGTLDPSRVSEEDVLEVHRLKSAIYTVASPLRLGCLLAGLPASRLADLSAVATDLGIAFQLRDDVLGAGLAPGAIGKSANDLVEGKRTLLVVRAWQRGSSMERAAIASVLGRPTATPAEVDRARDALRSSGALEYSERSIAQLREQALRRLRRSRSIPARGKPLLAEIADRLTNRTL